MDVGTVAQISQNRCTGCKACGDVCPTSAISFETDAEGFWYPNVDKGRCVECKRCVNVCPVSKDGAAANSGSMPKCAFAAWHKEDCVRREATSGGVFPAFGEFFLSGGGFLIGSSYSDDYKAAFHCVAEDKAGFERIKGSKYFQSDTGGIYERTKECISTGKPVLFVGTPCQVAALYHYLGTRPENLLTMDFICRGVSSPLLHRKKIEYYEKKGRSKVVFYRDKCKKYAWIDFGALIRFANGREKFVSRWRDEILHFFIAKNLNMRPSCYECCFKLGHMFSDLTIGDFWGIDRVTEKDLRYGVSALMVNTEKGGEFVELVRDRLYLARKPLERVLGRNPAYSAPPDRPSEREDFFDTIKSEGWEAARRKYRNFRSETRRQIRYHEKRMRLRPYLFLKEDRGKICWRKFVYYNWFCKSVIREKGVFLVPYKGAVIEIHPSARLYLKGNACINYTPYYPRGTQTAILQLREDAKVYLDNRLELGHGAMLSVASGAIFHAGYLMPRMGVNIICKYKMNFGENVGIGRDGCVMDSDFHPIMDENFEQINSDREVFVADNVWFGIRTITLKGAHIGHGSVIGTGSIVSGEVPNEVIYIDKRQKDVSRGVFFWEW